MAYESLNGTRKFGVLKPLEFNANRGLMSRPPPESWEPFQQTEPKRNKRERINEPPIENTSTLLPTVPRLVKTARFSDFHRMKFAFYH